MSADICAWDPLINLDPAAPDFFARLKKYSDPRTRKQPTPRMQQFVAMLLKKYPDLSADTAVQTAWADGPIIDDANGGFIHVSMIWPLYEEAANFFVQQAMIIGFVVYDPISGTILYKPKSTFSAWVADITSKFFSPSSFVVFALIAAVIAIRRRKRV